jgi:7-cyano-7-deazaguanine synthase in queuosine biosynthesis
VSATFSLSRLSKALVANLPDMLADLMEIAAYVYAADAAIRRGGTVAEGMGRDWRRDLRFTVPVRRRADWQKPEIANALHESLSYLSDDHYDFEFVDHDGRELAQSILLNYGPDDRTGADEVIMFSGGLDSFAGAAEALFDRQVRVALVSHQSAPITRRVQGTLVKALRNKTKDELVRHFGLEVKMRNGSAAEGSHRTRSFLFAVLGLVVAQAFGRDHVDFYENGVVSLNLAPLEQFVGTRATRSTHPLVLARLTRLFSVLLGQPFTVRNPYVWRTKADIIARIRDLGLGALLPETHSCANVRTADRMTPHCGRCSQCIDRRFAVLAAGCDRFDPAEMYGVDLLRGPRLKEDRELVLAYVRNARAWRSMTPETLLLSHPEAARVLDGLSVGSDQGLRLVSQLLGRHGRGVTEVMERVLRDPPESLHADSLVMLYAAVDRGQHRPILAVAKPGPGPFLIELDEERKVARLGGAKLVRGATYETLGPFVEEHLKSLGAGLASEDFSLVQAHRLMALWQLDEESSVRRRVKRLRGVFEDAGAPDGEIIENLPWKGYRLKPEAVRVRRTSLQQAV